jgi:23S rRNA pseudouridine1911/1915/1917 synthase
MTALTAIFAARDLERSYQALVWGVPSPLAGTIDGAIGRDPRERKRMAVRGVGGKQALTGYRTMRTWHGGVSLLECRLGTGRTHQIRVHLASTGHPVVGDPLYLRRVPTSAKLLPASVRGQLLDFPRQALHAAELGFRHPVTGAALSFKTPPPSDFNVVVAALDSSTTPNSTPGS